MPGCWRSAPTPRRCWRSISARRRCFDPGAGLITSALGTLLVFPAFRLRGHYVSIATLAIGEIVSLVILNWESLTRGAMGITGIPPLSLFGSNLFGPRGLLALPGVVVALALLQTRLLSSHLGRTCARSATTRSPRAPTASPRPLQGAGLRVRRLRRRRQRAHHRASLFLHQPPDLRLAALAAGADDGDPGRHGQCLGAILGAVALVGLPELFRSPRNIAC
jgi:branched-chain amino acid transport system permease protein